MEKHVLSFRIEPTFFLFLIRPSMLDILLFGWHTFSRESHLASVKIDIFSDAPKKTYLPVILAVCGFVEIRGVQKLLRWRSALLVMKSYLFLMRNFHPKWIYLLLCPSQGHAHIIKSQRLPFNEALCLFGIERNECLWNRRTHVYTR